jgi:uncharacterized protein
MITLPGLEPHEVAALIPAHPVIVAMRGSHSHGTYIAPEGGGVDDIDIIAAYIEPGLTPFFGVQHAPRGWDKKIKEWDCAAYEIRHLGSLLAAANPNVLSMLWAKDYIHLTRAGERLIAARDMFSTQAAGRSFSGYAYSQLKRMTAWSQEKGCCEGETFHLEGCELAASRGRGSAKKFATGFMGAKRKALVERDGYDTKNAAHLIRLLRMGLEFLSDGVLRVDRTGLDAEELIEIKKGKWPLEKVQAHATELFENFDDAMEISPLPAGPDKAAINDLLTDILCVELNAEISTRANNVLKEEVTHPKTQ